MKKSSPTLSSVHVPNTEDRLNARKERESFVPPKAAQNAAKQVLRWKEKYGDEVKGGTQVGWTRARQLASGEALSRDVVSRMAQFARHKKNSKVDPKHKNEPWKDAGHVAYKLWGGNVGVEWAQSVMNRLKKLSNGTPFSLKSRVSVDHRKKLSYLKPSSDTYFSPSVSFLAFKSDAPAISYALKKMGAKFMRANASGDSHTLFSLSKGNIPISIKPSSDVVWSKFLWNSGPDEVVSFSMGDSPFSKAFGNFQPTDPAARMRKNVSVSRGDNAYVPLTSDGFGESADVIYVDRCKGQSVPRFVRSNTSVRKQKTGPVSSFRCAFVEKGLVPADRVGRAVPNTPTSMRSKNLLSLKKISNSGSSTLELSGDFNGGDPLSVKIKDFTLMFGREECFGHVAWYMMGESDIQVNKSSNSEKSDVAEAADIVQNELEAIIRDVMDTMMSKSFTLTANVVKAEQQIAYGWASVVSVDGKELVDKQGHIISSAEMEKMANTFMMSQRVAKEMHAGGTVGEVIHSMPITKQLMDALGIEGKTEGWLIGVKINDPDVWKRVKDGTLKAFSIGGKGKLSDA